MALTIKAPLMGYSSEDKAYLVGDYPYGFTLRCKIRYWLEHNPKRGFRFVSQTSNPKRDHTWNTPKKSTYIGVAAFMFLDENQHVQWTGLSEYTSLIESEDWRDKYGQYLSPEALESLNDFISAKQKLNQLKAQGKVKIGNTVLEPETRPELSPENQS